MQEDDEGAREEPTVGGHLPDSDVLPPSTDFDDPAPPEEYLLFEPVQREAVLTSLLEGPDRTWEADHHKAVREFDASSVTLDLSSKEAQKVMSEMDAHDVFKPIDDASVQLQAIVRTHVLAGRLSGKERRVDEVLGTIAAASSS